MLRSLLSLLSLVLAAAAAGPAPSAARAKRILSPRAFPGWQTHNVAFPFVLVDARGRYRMFYAGSPPARINASTWDQWATLTATSTDAISWTFPDDYEPILVPRRFREGEVADLKDLAARFDSVAAFGASALQDPSGYRLWYTGWSGAHEPGPGGVAREVGFAIGLATSQDGATWARQAGDAGGGAVLAPGPAGAPDAGGAGQPIVLRDGDTLRMWYECFDRTRWRICAATSADGKGWAREGVVIDTGAEGALDALGARNPVVVRGTGGYELWYQGQAATGRRFRVLRADSADGRAWTKRAGEVSLHAESAVAADERIHVDSVVPLPGGGARVFFAREVTTTRQTPYGPLPTRRHHIYTEIVRP